MPADPAAPDIAARCPATLPAATSIIGIRRSRPNGDHAARTRSAAPAIMRSKTLPSPGCARLVWVIAADARPRIATITNFASITATRNSTRRRAHRLVAGQIIATNVRGRKNSAT
jgi:hypothetical protein